jgi:F0F1-type ATP synthase assembly protein I
MAHGAGPSSWHDVNSAWIVVSEFISAVLVYGAMGWFADRWLHTGHVLFLLGLVAGMALGIYVMIKRSDAMESGRRAARRSDRDTD